MFLKVMLKVMRLSVLKIQQEKIAIIIIIKLNLAFNWEILS